MAKKAARKRAAKSRKNVSSKSGKRSSPQEKTTRDPRLPAIGSVMTRSYKGADLSVKVLAGGFEFEGSTYKSLSGLARHIVGYQISGPVFFKLTGKSEGK